MSKLIQNATRAELDRGCVFAETFENSSEVSANGGTLSGTPSINFGAELNGTTDKITYNEVENINSISFWIILETTTENVLKLSSSHSITVSGGTVSATGFTSPTIYINGVDTSTITTVKSFVTIVTSTSFDADDLQVGYVSSFGEFKMWDLKIWREVLILQESLDYYNNSTYTYMNDAVVNLPMMLAHHDPTNLQTLDLSGNQYHVAFGDQVTSTTYPTKNSKRGYTYDGSTDYLDLPLSSFPGTSGSISMLIKPSPSSNMKMIGTEHSSGSTYETRCSVSGGNVYVNFGCGAAGVVSVILITDVQYNSYIPTTFTWEYITGTTYFKCYSRGSEESSGNVVGQVVTPDTAFTLGKWEAIDFYTGDINNTVISSTPLTPIQIFDLHHNMLQEVNNV